MIISHKHKFIFVHLGRTAGRALTKALAEHCGEDDIITPVGDTGQNYQGYRRHFTAREIRDRLGTERFEEYFKFTLERNPWEKVLSQYRAYVDNGRGRIYREIPKWIKGRPPNFDEWFRLKTWRARTIGLGHYKFPRHHDWYFDQGGLAVDFIGRHENLKEHLDAIGDRLSLKIGPLPTIGHRKAARGKPYVEYFDERKRRVVETIYAEDLDFLGYRFGEPFPTNYIERGA